MKAMLVCHGVLLGEEVNGKRDLQASSPDEIALLDGIEPLGYAFTDRNSDSITLTIRGSEQIYQILNTFEFSSERKRMTVLVKSPQGQILAYCKGADSTVFERLKTENRTAAYVEETARDLTLFANSGLRTLAIAFKVLDPTVYEEWNRRYQEVTLSMESTKEAQLNDLAEEMEKDFILGGGTGIEDKLAAEVPETIAVLLQASIKIWMITGDKQETAISVAKTCRMIEPDDQIIILQDPDLQSLRKTLQDSIPKYSNTPFVLVLSGHTLKLLLEDELKQLFMQLATAAKSVLCSRVSPLQKSLVTNLVKEQKKEITLAIGDGSNDVAMIQNAHIGVGIRGKEGSAAVLASDYSLGQFRFLKKLLLVHGRWSYYRVSSMFVYLFYKHTIITFIQLWICIFNGFSPQTYYDTYLGLGYHLLFTTWAIVTNSIFDQDVPKEVLLRFPQLYRQTQQNLYFNYQVFWAWLGLSVYSSTVIYFVNWATFRFDILYQNGQTFDLASVGISLFTHVIVLVNVKLVLETTSWTWLNSLVTLGSVAIYYFFSCAVYAIYSSSNGRTALYYWIPIVTYSTIGHWFTIPLMLVITLGPDVIIKYVRRNFFPKPHHIAQEIGKYGDSGGAGIEMSRSN